MGWINFVATEVGDQGMRQVLGILNILTVSDAKKRTGWIAPVRQLQFAYCKVIVTVGGSVSEDVPPVVSGCG